MFEILDVYHESQSQSAAFTWHGKKELLQKNHE